MARDKLKRENNENEQPVRGTRGARRKPASSPRFRSPALEPAEQQLSGSLREKNAVRSLLQKQVVNTRHYQKMSAEGAVASSLPVRKSLPPMRSRGSKAGIPETLLVGVVEPYW